MCFGGHGEGEMVEGAVAGRKRVREKSKFCAPNCLKRPPPPLNSQSESVPIYNMGMSKIEFFIKMFERFHSKNFVSF